MILDLTKLTQAEALEQVATFFSSSKETKSEKKEESDAFKHQLGNKEIKEGYESKTSANIAGRKAALFDPKEREKQVGRVAF